MVQMNDIEQIKIKKKKPTLQKLASFVCLGGDGLVVRMLAFYFGNPSLNPAEVYNLII